MKLFSWFFYFKIYFYSSEVPPNAARDQLFSFEVLMRQYSENADIPDNYDEKIETTTDIMNSTVLIESIPDKSETKNEKKQTYKTEKNHESISGKNVREFEKNNGEEINKISIIENNDVPAIIDDENEDCSSERFKLSVNSRLDDLSEDALKTNKNEITTFNDYKYKNDCSNIEEKTKKRNFCKVFSENNTTFSSTNAEFPKNDSPKVNTTVINFSHSLQNNSNSLASDDSFSTDCKTEAKLVPKISSTPLSVTLPKSNSTETLTAYVVQKSKISTESTLEDISSIQKTKPSKTTFPTRSSPTTTTTDPKAPSNRTELLSDCKIVYTGSETQCKVKELNPGCLYAFKIRASNSAGVSLWMF